MKSISLSELTKRIEEAINLNFSQMIWIRAEISELRENNGHCYLELIEKSEDSEAIIAKSSANCWASTYRNLKLYFEDKTGSTLRAGIKVLVGVSVNFHSVYGFKLVIQDIDPVFTIGELAAQRQQTIRQLEADGIATMNKTLQIPTPAQRIAVISSKTAAGYDDFINQLKRNAHGYAFYTRLFPAVMQGSGTESSIIAALEQIFEVLEDFDLVAIIRGGGATTDLSAFDSYLLALNCAQFPLPILSGIGHQRDISVLDFVAHTSVKTPTAAAEFLVANLQQTENRVDYLADTIISIAENKKKEEERRVSDVQHKIRYALRNIVLKREGELKNYTLLFPSIVRMQIKKQEYKLKLLEKGIEAHSPSFLLQHGYSITTLNGKKISSAKETKEGDRIRTFFFDGNIESEVIK